MKQALGKTALAGALFYGFNIFLSIPIGIAAGVIAAARGMDVLSAEAIVELLFADPLLRTLSFTMSSAAGAATAAILYYFLEKERDWTLGWKQRGWFAKGLLGLALGALLIGLAFVLVHLFGGVRVIGVNPLRETALSLAFDAVLFTAVAIGEETLSRGYVYGVVRRRLGAAAAAAASSLLFAVLHANNFGVFESIFPMLNLFLAGVMLALLREWSGGLWVPIGVHIAWNYVQGDVFGMAVSGVQLQSLLQVETLNPALAGGNFGLEGSPVTSAVLLLTIAWLVAAVRQGNRGDGAPAA